VVLVSRGSARFFNGVAGAVEEGRRDHHDEYEREVEYERHLRETAQRVDRSLREDGWTCLLIGGHHELIDQFRELLSDPVLRHLVGTFDADVEHLSAAAVCDRTLDAEAALAEEHLTGLLNRFQSGLATGNATAGFDDTRFVLEERRVEALLLDADCEAEDELRAAVAQDATVHRVDPVEHPSFAGREIGAVLRF
jgi:peptide subunit release factor 1 (eRF1)